MGDAGSKTAKSKAGRRDQKDVSRGREGGG